MLNRIEAPSLAELALREIRRLILAGEFKPGDRLVEERLCEQLGISRPPVREALRILQREGLVVTQPRRGSIVVPLTAADVEEIFSLRAALERMAAERGVPCQSEPRLNSLREAQERIAETARAGDRPGLVAANIEFHQAFADLPGHRRLSDTYRTLALQLQLCMALNLQVRERLYGSLDENVVRHRRLLTLVESGDRRAVLHELSFHESRTFMRELQQLLPS